MAKAKTGFSASQSKDKEVVGTSFKRLLSLVVLLGIATVAKLNADYQYVESWVSNYASDLWSDESSSPNYSQQRSLKAIKSPIVAAHEEDVEEDETVAESLNSKIYDLGQSWYSKLKGSKTVGTQTE